MLKNMNSINDVLKEGDSLLREFRAHCEDYQQDDLKEFKPTIESIHKAHQSSSILSEKINDWRKNASKIDMSKLSEENHDEILKLKSQLSKAQSSILELVTKSKKLVDRLVELDRYSPTFSKDKQFKR